MTIAEPAPARTVASLLDRLADLLLVGESETGTRWLHTARPEQVPPAGSWRWWLACAGRGWGKTRACAEWAAKKARRYPGARIALVAITFGDGRDTMVEGDSGLLSVLDPAELRGGSIDAAWNRSLGELFMANGSRFKIYSSERPRQLRGPQHHFLWGDEPAYWLDAQRGTAKDSTFSNANFGLRLPARPGWDDEYRPQGVLATTPKRVALLKVPDNLLRDKPELAGLLQRNDVLVVTGKTTENLQNLSKDYYDAVIAPLIGTTLGRQELDAVLDQDVEGALWKQAQIDADRVEDNAVPILTRRVVSFDPSGGGGPGHDEHGITVVGVTGARPDVAFYLLADLSLNGTPNEAARAVLLASVAHDAPTVVYEKNQGQDWIPTVLATVWQQLLDEGKVEGAPPKFADLTASRSKEKRARPVQALSEQHRIHHVGSFPELEGQLTGWVPEEDPDSPDRLDAFVHGVNWLYSHAYGNADIASPARRVGSARLPAAVQMRR